MNELEQTQSFFGWFAVNKDGIIALGVFLTALVSITAAVLAYTIQRKTALSTMRERWIETLRGEVAEALSYQWAIRHSEDMEAEQKAKLSLKFNDVRNRIRLRLNVAEAEHRDLEDALDRFRKHMNRLSRASSAADRQAAIKGLNEAENTVVNAARVIGRLEWKRAVRGE